MGAGFEEMDHTADVALHVWGRDLSELFAEAALGMAEQLADPGSVERAVRHEIDLSAPDVETLLVSWLGELLYLGELEGSSMAIFVEFEMQDVSRTHLRALAWGGPAGEYRRYVKAVTFSDLAVRRLETGYETTIVFDV